VISVPSLWLVVAECFLGVLAVGVCVGLWFSRRRIFSRAAVLPMLLAALALLLRFLAHPGPADIRAVLHETGARRAGWAALVELVYHVLPQDDETIWTLNRVVGALSVPLLYAVMRRRFRDPVAAAGGAAALAVTPLIVRFSASDTPYILLCAAFLGALVAYDNYIESGSIGSFVLALGLLSAAMQLRPEGLWLVVPAGLLALAHRTPSPTVLARIRARPALVALAICAVLFVVINAAPAAWAVQDNERYLDRFVLVGTIMGSPWADPNTTPRALAALVIPGVLWALLSQRAGILWLAATLVAWPLNFPATAQYANARYHMVAMYLICGLAGLGGAALLALAGRLRRRAIPAPGLVAVVVVLLAAMPRFDLLWRMWTPQREYEVFRDGLTRVPADCRVVTMKNSMDAGFVPFDYLVPGRLVDIPELLADPSPHGCLVYYRCGNCSVEGLVPEADRRRLFEKRLNLACRAIEERFQLEPIVESEIAAVPYRGEIYARDPLVVGFYRLRNR
jgi:dolichyl-phosphate-mannose-protein mannosyltransferase